MRKKEPATELSLVRILSIYRNAAKIELKFYD